jgi:hypothetical protein
MELSNYGLPRKVKERMICEYLSGVKTLRMLSAESGMSYTAIKQMVLHHKDKFMPTFEQKLTVFPTMKQKSKRENSIDPKGEPEELRRQLKEAQLKIEGYEIMGDILEEEYGIDLLKKSGAKQSPDSANDTQK